MKVKFHSLLENHILYQKLITEALEERVLFFQPQAPEKSLNQVSGEYPIADREGLYSEDISGYVTPTIKDYFKLNWESYLEGYAVYTESLVPAKNIFQKIKNDFRKLSALVKALNFVSFSTPWTHWVWVVDSLDSVAHDIVIKEMRKNHSYSMDEYKAQVQKITREQKIAYLDSIYLKISDRMWVSETDPGVIVYDNHQKPYQLKDGWSYEQVGEILSEWVLLMTGEKVQAIAPSTEDLD